MSSSAARKSSLFVPNADDGFALEMESLVEETSDRVAFAGDNKNQSRKQQQQQQVQYTSCFSIKWVAMACFLLTIGGLALQQARRPDPNTLETNVDALPLAEHSGSATADDTTTTATTTSNIDGSSTTTTTKQQAKKPNSDTVTTTEDLPHPDEPAGYRHPASYFSDIYVRRAKPDRQTGTAAATLLAELWGSWTFVDPASTSTSTSTTKRLSPEQWDELALQYPNRDVPLEAFPATAWQVDSDYLQPFLNQGIALTERALKAILAEYGHYDITEEQEQEQNAKKLLLETALLDADATQNAYMFNLTVFSGNEKYNFKHPPGNAGFVTQPFLDNLKRYLLHAVVTQDSFFFTMGGHSSSAAHGNHFQQSYTLQVQRALEPVLARLGVFHISRNIGMGGLGTAHNGLGSTDMYGGDNDILMWDSGMTENDWTYRDLFTRQAVLSRQKVPLLYGAIPNPALGQIQTGHWGAGFAGLRKTETVAGIVDMPYATRYIDCSPAVNSVCRKDGYNGVCWIEREDFTPPTKQGPMGGRAKWHPGNIYHQYTSRFIVFTILKTLRQALLEWQSMENYSLPDDAWHLTPLYEKARARVTTTTTTDNDNDDVMPQNCFGLALPDIACTTSFHARSEMSPRANPRETSIRSILHPSVNVPDPKPNVYDPPDVYNAALDPPDGHIDYLAIVENGIDFLPLVQRRKYFLRQIQPLPTPRSSAALRKEVSGLPPGQGWNLDVAAAADNCDGTYDSFCARPAGSNCLLYGHNDYRGALIGDALSGWLIMTLQDVRLGTIMLKMLGSGVSYGNARTLGWKCENNASACEHPISDQDAAGKIGEKEGGEPCDDYGLEFAIDGVITKWNREEMVAHKVSVQRMVEVYMLQNKTDFAPQGTDVELAFRIAGNCGRRVSFHVSQLYWA